MRRVISLRSMSRRGTVNMWLFIISVCAGPLFYLLTPKLWSFALVSRALMCVTPILVAIFLLPLIAQCAQGSVRDAVRFRRRLSSKAMKVVCVVLVTLDCGLLGLGAVLSAPVVADAISGSQELTVRCLDHQEETSTVMQRRSAKSRVFITRLTLATESDEHISVTFYDGFNYRSNEAYKRLRKHCNYEDAFKVSIYPRTRVITQID